MPGKDDSAENRRSKRREMTRRRTIMRRRLVAIAVVAVPLVLIIGVLLASGGGDEPPPGPTEQELAAERARELARKKAREERAVSRVAENTESGIRSGGGKRRLVALTFDDGPGPSTGEILKILRRTKTPATFFAVGTMVKEDPKMLKRVEREGHAVGNHTQNHPPMGQLDVVSQNQEVSQADEAIRKAGVEPRSLFRPPYRSFNETTVNLLQERGDLMVLWDVDTEDYANPDPQGMVDRVMAEVMPGAIVLMHDGPSPRESTVKALPGIIRGLRKQNYRLVTIPQMMVLDPPSATGEREPSADEPDPATGEPESGDAASAGM